MHNLDPPFDPRSHSFRERLSGLCRSLEELASRLHEGIARVVSQAVADVVQDTVRQLWSRLVVTRPQPRTVPLRDRFNGWNANQYEDNDPLWRRERTDRFGHEDAEEDEEEPTSDAEAEESSQSTWPTALAVGLQATAWWLRRRVAQVSVPAAVAVGVVSALGAYFCGPLAAAGAHLAVSSLTLLKLAQATQNVASGFPFLS